MTSVLQRQFSYLRELRRIGRGNLKLLHDQTFAGTEYSVFIPANSHRSVYERRLWYHFCGWICPAYKEDELERFRERARFILSQDYADNLESVEERKVRELGERDRFSTWSIRNMEIDDVDRYLAILGFSIRGTEEERKQALWEYFNKPIEEQYLPGLHARMKKANRDPNRDIKNRRIFVLTKLVLINKNLTYDEFMVAFGSFFPRLNRRYFSQVRYGLRRKGFFIPKLLSGRKKTYDPSRYEGEEPASGYKQESPSKEEEARLRGLQSEWIPEDDNC